MDLIMKIEKLNVILEVTPSLTERQYINVLTIIKEGYKEELKTLKQKTRKKLFTDRNKLDKVTRRSIVADFNKQKLKLKLKYFPTTVKAMIRAKGEKALETIGKHKKPLIAAGITAGALAGYTGYKSAKRHKEAKKKLGIE